MLCAMALAGCVSVVDWGSYDPKSLDAMTPEAWKSDLDELDSGLRRLHGATMFHGVSEADFTVALERAKSRADTATNDEMLVELYRLLALVGEGHTSVNATQDLTFPVQIRWYPEGVYVVYGPSDRADLLGRRVLSVGGLSVPELEAAIDPLVSADLEAGKPVARPSIVSNVRLMRGLGLAPNDELALEVEGLGVARIPALRRGEAFEGRSYLQTLSQESLPISLRPKGVPYWYGLDESSGLLYLRYDVCDSRAEPVFAEVLEHLREGRAERLVLDLRWNGGGNSAPGTEFARAVSRIPSINREGSLYVFIGPRTFSSAMMNAMDFRAHTRAILAGESLVEPAGHYGEVRRFELPESGLVIGTSTRFWEYGLGLVPAGQSSETWVLEPHPGWEIPWTWADYSRASIP